MCNIPGKILVVEDDKFSSKLLKLQIKKIAPNVEIHIAKSSDEALKRIQSGKYIIMLADVCMPVMSGVELVEKVIHLESSPSIIIFMSASMYREKEIDGITVLEKPLSFDVLQKLITGALKLSKVPELVHNATIKLENINGQFRNAKVKRRWRFA